jgi:hypothetical protein
MLDENDVASIPTEDVASVPQSVSDDVAEDDADTQAVDDEGQDDEDVVEELEFDFGGNKIKVPKGSTVDEVAERLQAYAKSIEGDYIGKTQSIAEERRALEAQSQALAKLSQIKGEALQEYSRGMQLKSELQKLQEIDLPSLWQSNSDQARMVSDLLASKRQEFNQVVAKVHQFEVGFEHQQAQTIQQMADQVAYAVKNYGVSEADAKTWPLNPTSAIMAYKAMQFDKMQSKVAKATKPNPAQPVPVTAVKSKVSNGSSKEPSDRDSVNDWLKKREAQIRANRAR